MHTRQSPGNGRPDMRRSQSLSAPPSFCLTLIHSFPTMLSRKGQSMLSLQLPRNPHSFQCLAFLPRWLTPDLLIHSSHSRRIPAINTRALSTTNLNHEQNSARFSSLPFSSLPLTRHIGRCFHLHHLPCHPNGEASCKFSVGRRYSRFLPAAGLFTTSLSANGIPVLSSHLTTRRKRWWFLEVVGVPQAC